MDSYFTWKGLTIGISDHVKTRMHQRRVTESMVLETLNRPTKAEPGHARVSGVTHKIWRKLPNGKRHCIVIACDADGTNNLVTTYVRGSGWKLARR